MKKLLIALALGACVAAPASAATASYSFNCLTQTNAANCGIGQAQLFMDVSDTLVASQVLFEFHNTGPAASSLTDVYFDDGSLLGIAQVFNGPGVSFSPPAKPGDLPGGNKASPAFQTTAGFSADSDAPVSPNGVNPGEKVGILFNLISGQSFADVVNALGIAGGANGLRVGVHVQSFGNGGSESFINAVSPVPEAKQWLMMLLGISVIATRAMRR
ncbi:MAG: hypothetical protein IV108_01095 [Burkholderiales bacterium]|nr:hypothetical protein [Burkholderiales bacterium]